jgi:chaperone BCS1
MDVWVNFTHATKWQAEGIFKCFFPSKPSFSSPPSASTSQKDTANSTAAVTIQADSSQKNLPVPKRNASTHTGPLLDEDEISELAKRFADAIPEDELSVCLIRFSAPLGFQLTDDDGVLLKVASLQGYLLKNKTRPRECVEEVAKW